MESEKNQSATQTPESEYATRSTSSCRRVKSENAGFIANMRNSFSDFIHASTDEHKACFLKSVRKVLDNLNRDSIFPRR